jgi:hypothetical protein
MNTLQQFGITLLLIGLGITGVAVVLIFLPSIPWLGRLPGDIRIETERVRFYFPLVTCIVVSALATLLLFLIRWLGQKGG